MVLVAKDLVKEALEDVIYHVPQYDAKVSLLAKRFQNGEHFSCMYSSR
jgi:hypothetical protein